MELLPQWAARMDELSVFSRTRSSHACTGEGCLEDDSVPREPAQTAGVADQGPGKQVLALLDSVTEAVFSFDASWNYTYLNAAACAFLQRPRDELLGRNAWQLYPEARHGENAQILQRCMRDREAASWTSYSPFVHTWFQWRAFPIPDDGVALVVSSIDARVRAEQAHADSEQRFRALADLAPCMIWMTDASGHLSWCNQRWLAYSGLSESEARSSRFAGLHPQDADIAWEHFTAAADAKRPASLEIRLRRHDGAYRWHLSQMQPILDVGGEIAYWLGSATDIQTTRDALAAEQEAVSAQTMARNHAERERERLRRVLEQAPFGVAVTSGPQHILRSANERQLRLFGQRVTMNLPLRASFPEKDLEPVHALFDRAFHDREPVVLREQHVGWDRTGQGVIEYGYFDLIYQPIMDELNRVEGLLCVSTEVSDSVNARLEVSAARDEAEHARARLHQILATIPAAIAVTRGPDHVYDLVNAAAVGLTGPRELLGHSVRELFPELLDGYIAVLDRVYASGEHIKLVESRIVYTREMGQPPYEGYFTIFLAPLLARDGQITGVVAAGIEVTEQVRQRAHNEALRKEADRAHVALEQAHAQLERRIAARTRELATSNEALAAEIAIRREAEGARTDLARRLNTAREDEQRRTARDLHDQVGQTLSALMLSIKTACEAAPLPESTMTRLTDALALAEDLGRDVHGIATRLRPAVLDRFGLYAALRQLLTDWSERCSTRVDLEAEWVKNKRYPADIETALYRVTQEALTNVARHARATHVSVVVERSAGQLICIVEDDGVGFEVHAVTPGRMGLESMRERATLIGGTLDLESQPGGGTTVIVSIPLREQ